VIAESGEWAERNRLAAAGLVARTDYYNQDRYDRAIAPASARTSWPTRSGAPAAGPAAT
jgi:hypothetical protein